MSQVSTALQESAEGPNPSAFAPYAMKFYRNDIQGIRAISALLIMIYHIWLDRVSGGVDVFFVISGFLMTTTLLRGLASTGEVRPVDFWARICRRIFPSAYTVLIVTLVLSLVFVPAPLWKYSVNEFITSAAQLENLELLRMGADYLAREAPPSQFQQFWALSIQMQFYLALPFLVMLLANFARRAATLKPLFWGIALIATASFAFSVFLTHVEPNEAYFHPLTRIWEFLAGALVAVAYPKISALASRPQLWNVLAISAALGLATLGLTLGGTAAFPGWVALVPVLCAVVLLATGGRTNDPTILTKALSNRTLVYLGSFSFTIYLWHWPVLVFAHHQLGTTKLSLLQGLGVIAIAIALAVITTRFIEEPLTRGPIMKPWRRLAGQVAFMLAIVTFGLILRQGIAHVSADQRGNLEHISAASPLEIQQEVDIPIEKFIGIDLDRPSGIGCLSRECVGGDPNAEKLIVMAGASHSAQWFDVIDQFGKDHGYRVITRLSNDDLLGIVAETGADALVMNSTQTAFSGSGVSERMSDDQARQWARLSDNGVDVVVIRDNPRFGFYQNACIWQHQDDAAECAIEQSELFQDVDPAAALADELDNFYAIDLTDLFCVDGICPAVHDNVMMYYDKHHISKSYSNYIEEGVIKELLESGAFRRDERH